MLKLRYCEKVTQFEKISLSENLNFNQLFRKDTRILKNMYDKKPSKAGYCSHLISLGGSDKPQDCTGKI